MSQRHPGDPLPEVSEEKVHRKWNEIGRLSAVPSLYSLFRERHRRKTNVSSRVFPFFFIIIKVEFNCSALPAWASDEDIADL